MVLSNYTCIGAFMDRCTDSEQRTAAIYAPLLFQKHKQDMDIRKQISNCWDYCSRKKWEVRYVFVEQCKIEDTLSELKSHRILEKAKAEDLDFIVFWELRLFKVDYIKVKSKKHAQATRPTALGNELSRRNKVRHGKNLN